MKHVLFVLVIAFLSPLTFAGPDKGFYVGASTVLASIGLEDAYEKEVRFKALEALIGYKHNNYLGIEVRGGATPRGENVLIAEDETTGAEEVVEANIDYYGAVYYRAELTNDIAKAYLLFGGAAMKVTSEFDTGVESANEATGLSYGLGTSLVVGDSFYFNIEAKSLIHTSDDIYVGYGASITFHF